MVNKIGDCKPKIQVCGARERKRNPEVSYQGVDPKFTGKGKLVHLFVKIC